MSSCARRPRRSRRRSCAGSESPSGHRQRRPRLRLPPRARRQAQTGSARTGSARMAGRGGHPRPRHPPRPRPRRPPRRRPLRRTAPRPVPLTWGRRPRAQLRPLRPPHPARPRRPSRASGRTRTSHGRADRARVRARVRAPGPGLATTRSVPPRPAWAPARTRRRPGRDSRVPVVRQARARAAGQDSPQAGRALAVPVPGGPAPLTCRAPAARGRAR